MAIISGISYPLTISATGNLEVSDDANLIRDNILSWLETFKRERISPDYGLKFYVGTTENRADIESQIYSDLVREIPDTTFRVNVRLDDTGLLQINVNYAPRQFEGRENFLSVLLNV